MAHQRFAIAHVTPHAWEAHQDALNLRVRELADGLAGRGHSVLILAPSRSAERVRASRQELRALREDPGRPLEQAARCGAPAVIAVGEVLDVGAQPGSRASGSRVSRRARSLPIDVSRTIEELLSVLPLDFVHVHEPFPPSAPSAALRHSRALNVGSFYAPPPQAASAALARRFTESYLQRLDARLDGPHDLNAVEALYRTLAARRHDTRADPALRHRLAGRPLVDVDLHMHTDHSHDCATPVEVLLATAREQRLGAIAVTDHNEISGALEARQKAAASGAHPPLNVIVGEEIKTATQGEVIGLFIERKIPRGLSMADTIAEIKAQGGIVYIPHPFDRMHSVPDYQHLLPVLDDIDAIEVFNPRVAIGAFNDEAARFAAKYRIPAGAGSDAHVAQGLGSVRVRMRDFNGPAEFLQSLRDAQLLTKPSSLIYVQALKFLQTKATPASARRAARQRRVRKATEGRP